MGFRDRLGWLLSQGSSAPRQGQSTSQAGSSSSQCSARHSPTPQPERRRTARAGLQHDLSDLKAQIPSGCGGKAMGLRHISHLGTWGNQSLCSEILQTFWKHVPSDLDVPFGSQHVAGAGPSPPAAEPGVTLIHASLKPVRAGGSDGSTRAGTGQESSAQRGFCMREKSLRSCYTVRSESSLGTCFRL